MMHRRVSIATWQVVVLALFLPLVLAACGGGGDPSNVVMIESEPEPGAMVIIGSKNYGTTPVTLYDLPAGQYYAILSLYGYKRTTHAFQVPEEGDLAIVVPMAKIVGYLTIDSEPPRAEVFLDGAERLGTTPLVNVPLPPGHYTYEVRLENYRTETGSIVVEENYRYNRLHALKPLQGWVQVFSRPSGSDVFINDVKQAKKTPASFQLAPGLYTFATYQRGYMLAEKSLTIEPNAKHSVDLILKEGYMPPGMVLVPEGEFICGFATGAPDERPSRKLQLPAFFIDKYEVTNKEFSAVFPNRPFDAHNADSPVTGVTWNQANQYAQAVGKRLPSEAEWEKAARGADGREYPWGNTFNQDLCNSSTGFNDGPKRVGEYRAGASPYGVMDMAGNVYEWTADWYQPYKGNTDISVEYGQVFRVLRGGSFLTDRFGVRCARRHYDKVENTRADYGFRCAMDAHLPSDPAK